MAGRKSFQLRLFISVGGIFLLFALFFGIYQYNREKVYKIEALECRLQNYNLGIYSALGKEGLLDPNLVDDYEKHHPMAGLRVTIIDTLGKVLLDSEQRDVSGMGNHRHRTEVATAIENGSGYDIKRESQSLHSTFFYSATRFDDLIVRVAIPYSPDLSRILSTDKDYITYTIIITLLLGWVLYRNTRRISHHIEYLRRFAQKVENGEKIDTEVEKKMPNDELADISQTIVALYMQLQHSEEDKQRIKRQLTLNVAHELKTPAASIQGFLESILQNPDIPEEKKQHFLQRCLAQSERMCNLLADMDSLTKIDEFGNNEGKTKLERRPVDVNAIIHAALDDTALQMQQKDILPTLDIPGSICVMGDPSLIYSIFRNLLDNSIAYATGATNINISYERKGELCLFTVADNGCGVPEEHLPHIFERFYRVDKGRSRKLGGTGLGLAIVKNAVTLHGGTCTAFNTPGGGLSISFTLRMS